MSNDFNLDDLFRDEFKPDFSHVDTHKVSPAPDSKVEEIHPLAIDSSEMAPEYSGVDISTPPQNEYDDEGNIVDEYELLMQGMGAAPEYPVEAKPVENMDDALADLRRRLMGNDEEVRAENSEVEDIAEELEEAIYEGEIVRPWTGPESNPVQFDVLKASKGEQPWSDEEEYVKGELVSYEAPAIEGTVIEPTKTGPTALEIAVAELERVKAIDIDNDAQKNALRAKINETQRILDNMKNELTTLSNKHYDVKRAVKEAEAHVSEEAHIQAELQREEEIKAQRKHAMMQFHSHIEDLSPEWKDYAFDHQWEGASTLALHESGLLADEMGLGKTLTAVMYLDMVKAERVLVVTPNDTCSNFTMEIAMWAKHRFTWSLAGADKLARNTFINMILQPRLDEGKDLTLTVNFEQLYSDMDYFEQLKSMKFDTIIIDEAHNFKEKKSILFQRLKELRGSGVKRILPMTGTFILNKPEDIWPALHLVDAEAFPTVGQFRDHYCEYDVYTSKYVFRPGGERSMLIRLGGRIVKRDFKELVAEGKMKPLPEMHMHEEDCILGFPENAYEDQKNIMRQLADHSQIILDSERKVSIPEQIALITRQRQCAVWPAGINIKDPMTGEIVFSVGEDVRESIKLDWVESKIKELRNGNKRIAVFSQFKTALAELERRLVAEGFRVVRYDGDTNNETKALVKRDFDRRHVDKTGNYNWDIVLCNFKTGGVGLNFTHITDMIMLDEEWNPGKNQQAYKRIHRIGQTEETHVWIPRLIGSIDNWMKALNDQKADLIAGFNNEVDLQKEFSDFLATVRQTV